MSWAYIYTPKDKKYFYAKTVEIDDFDEEKFIDEDSTKRTEKVYKVSTNDGRIKCQVLAVQKTLKALKTEVTSKRIRVPKLNASQLEDSRSEKRKLDDGNESEAERSTAKKSKKAKKRSQEAAKRAGEDDIIGDYEANQLVNEGRKESKSGKGQTVKKAKSRDSLNLAEEPSEPEEPIEEVFDDVSLEDNKTVKGESKKEKIQAMANRIEELENEVTCWKRKYVDLEAIHAVCPKEDVEPPVGEVRDEKVHLGYNVWVKKIAYDEAAAKQDGSKFVHSMCRSIWTEQELAKMTTRETADSDRVLFSPKREAALRGIFVKWTTDKFNAERAAVEKAALNTYLNRVTAGARSRHNKKTAPKP